MVYWVRKLFSGGLTLNADLPFSVLTSNIISLLLLGTLYLSNRQRINRDEEMQILLQMMGITALSNVADCCVYYLDSSSGAVLKALVYLSGSWLYLGNVLLGCAWARFLMTHLGIPFTAVRQRVYRLGRIVSCLLLLLNLFCPLVFTVTDQGYQRGLGYSIFLLFALFYILDSLHLYAGCRKKTGALKLFPVHVFLFPVTIGVVVQALFPEIAITWTSVAIALAGILTALKNELIFLDGLTGLYNRMYLQFLQNQAYKKTNVRVSGIMIDLNGFKQINDTYGHSEGDAALILAAGLLRKSFAEYGVVTRYAGDEFVVMLNTTDQPFVQQLIRQAKENFAEASRTSGKPYLLSAAMGYAISDLSVETIDDFMNRIDRQMYQDKLAYYQKHDRRKSRSRPGTSAPV